MIQTHLFDRFFDRLFNRLPDSLFNIFENHFMKLS
jgi:hypothetical protein